MLNARVSFILLFFQCLRVAGFASWFATDSQYCSRVMKDGEIIMNNPAANSNDRSIQVFRNSEPIENGATYMPGDKLDILLSEVEGQFVIETTRGTFEDGGCDGKRSIQSPVVLVLPDDGGEDINIWAGWAYGHSQVLISPTFTLKGTPGTVRAEITKEAHPEAKKQGLRGAMKLIRATTRNSNFLLGVLAVIVVLFLLFLYKFVIRFRYGKYFTKST